MGFFDHLETDINQAPARRAKPDAPTFPCQSCAGTGRWSGGRNQKGESKCFACGGRGSFTKSREDRLAASAKYKARKARSIQETMDAFKESNPGLIERAEAICEWHGFASAMLANYRQYGSLTEKQTIALVASLDRAEATKAMRQAAREAKGGDVDATAIKALFDKASASGLKRPVFRTEHFDLSLAPPFGKNPGAIYVKSGSTYLGKISDNKFFASRDATDTTRETLRAVAENPLDVAVKFGRLTGRCGCCGRDLTDPESVARGIGPICAGKWGI